MPSDRVPDREERLAEVVAEIQDKLNRGETLERDDYLGRFPEFKQDLAGYFSCGSFLETALGSDTPGPFGASSRPEFDSIDLREFPIEGQLDDESLGPVFRISAGADQGARELVVMRAKPHPRVAARLEDAVSFIRSRPVSGLPGPLSFDRFEKTPFIIRESGEGRDLRRLLKKLILAGGKRGIHQVIAKQAPELELPAEDNLDRQERRKLAARLAGHRGHIDALLSLFEGWAAILDRAHEAGIVHGSISPRCLALDDQGACMIRGVGVGPLAMNGTAKNAPPSDRRWLAPEVAHPDSVPLTWKADVYGLALSLAGALSLDLPYWESGPLEVLERLGTGAEAPSLSLPDALDASLKKTIEQALSADPLQRPASAGAFAAVLSRARRTRVLGGLRVPRSALILSLFVIAAGLVTALFLMTR